MRWILWSVFVATVAASVFPPPAPPDRRIRSDQYDLQPTPDDEFDGGPNLELCAVNSAC